MGIITGKMEKNIKGGHGNQIIDQNRSFV